MGDLSRESLLGKIDGLEKTHDDFRAQVFFSSALHRMHRRVLRANTWSFHLQGRPEEGLLYELPIRAT